jgi:phage gpG-like protein
MIKGQIKNKRVFTGFLKRLEKFGTSTYVKRDVSVRCARRYRVALKKYIRNTKFAPLKYSTLLRYGIRRIRPGKTHYATLIRTKKYINSIHLEKSGENTVVTSDVEYSVYHEIGTRNMVARPHWIPALDKCVSDGDFDKIVEQYVSSFLQGKL